MYKLLIDVCMCHIDCFLKTNAVIIIRSYCQAGDAQSGALQSMGDVCLRTLQIHKYDCRLGVVGVWDHGERSNFVRWHLRTSILGEGQVFRGQGVQAQG